MTAEDNSKCNACGKTIAHGEGHYSNLIDENNIGALCIPCAKDAGLTSPDDQLNDELAAVCSSNSLEIESRTGSNLP